MGAGVPVIPTIIWGSQRIWTKGIKRNLRRNHVPISIAIGEPIFFAKDQDVPKAEEALRTQMKQMLDKIQRDYPDDHVGQWWAPARLGGTAPAPLNS